MTLIFFRTGGAYAPAENIIKKEVQTKPKQKQQQKGELKLKKQKKKQGRAITMSALAIN